MLLCMYRNSLCRGGDPHPGFAIGPCRRFFHSPLLPLVPLHLHPQPARSPCSLFVGSSCVSQTLLLHVCCPVLAFVCVHDATVLHGAVSLSIVLVGPLCIDGSYPWQNSFCLSSLCRSWGCRLLCYFKVLRRLLYRGGPTFCVVHLVISGELFTRVSLVLFEQTHRVADVSTYV